MLFTPKDFSLQFLKEFNNNASRNLHQVSIAGINYINIPKPNLNNHQEVIVIDVHCDRQGLRDLLNQVNTINKSIFKIVSKIIIF